MTVQVQLLVLELLRRTVLVGVVLIGTMILDIVLVVHLGGVLPGLVLGTLTVVGVHALGLGELVDFTTDEAGKKLLGKLVRDWLAWTRSGTENELQCL